jgi:hypothetical protein
MVTSSNALLLTFGTIAYNTADSPMVSPVCRKQKQKWILLFLIGTKDFSGHHQEAWSVLM